MNKHVPCKRKKRGKQQKHNTSVSLIKPRKRRPDLLRSFKSRDKLEPKKSYRSSKRKVSLKLDVKKLQTLRPRERNLIMKASCLNSKACNVERLKTSR